MSISYELSKRESPDFDLYKDIPDFYKTHDLSDDEFVNDGYRKMTVEERRIYHRQITESDGFDVDPLPVFGYGLIQPNHCDSNACFWAEYAIGHYNASQGVKLQLDKVVKINTQAACCLENHYITFTATETATGVTKTYQAKVCEGIPCDKSEVGIFREKPVDQYNEADTVRFLAIFAINNYNRTKGEDVRLIHIITCDQGDGSLTITFKATNLSTCMTEIYRTEVVSRAPIVESVVKYFMKLPDPSAYQDEKDEEESKAASIISGLKKMRFSTNQSISHKGQDQKIEEHDAKSSTSPAELVEKKP